MLSNYHDCPRRSAVRIMQADIEALGYTFAPRRASIGAAVGTGAHAVAAYLAKIKMQSGENPPENELTNGIEIGITEYRSEISDGVEYDTTTTGANDAEKQISVIGAEVHNRIIPTLDIVSAEPEPLTASMAGIDITGRWDIETPAGIDDYKTGVKSRPAHAQLGGYSLLRSTHGKQRADKLRVFFLPRVPVKKVFPGVSIIEYAPEVCERIAFATVKHIVRDIENFKRTQEPMVFPVNPSSMMCSRKYCAAFGTSWCEFTCGK